jgi:hypothetical protein
MAGNRPPVQGLKTGSAAFAARVAVEAAQDRNDLGNYDLV